MIDRQTDRHTYLYVHKKRERETDRQTDRKPFLIVPGPQLINLLRR